MSIEFILLIAIGVIGMIVQARLQSVFNKYSKVMFTGGMTGRDVAAFVRSNGRGCNRVAVVDTIRQVDRGIYAAQNA